MARTMKAGITVDPKEKIIEVQERPIPEIGPKDVLVKTLRSSICGTDVAGYSAAPGKEFGHETVGRIAEVGKEVTDFKEGDRVWCHCVHIMGGLLSCQFPGFSEYSLIKDPKPYRELWPVPDAITNDQASIIEPFGVGTRGKNRPGAKPGDNVIVYGAGSIGLFCLSSLIAQGLKPVVIDIVLSDYKRALLNEMGVIVAPLPDEGDKFEFLKELWGEIPQRNSGTAINVDIVVDCAGAPSVVDDFIVNMSKEHARLVTLGIGRPQEVPLSRMMSAETAIMGSSGYNDSDIKEVFDNLSNNKTPWIEKVITHHFPLDELPQAMKMAANREEAIKVVVDME